MEKYTKKREVHMLISALVFSVILLMGIGNASAALNMRINAKLAGFNTDFITITDSDAKDGYDGFDTKVPYTPSNYSSFYSTVEGNQLSVDVWGTEATSRIFNLTYATSPLTAGTLNLSWSFSSSEYDSYLTDYGNDSGYQTASSSEVNMESTSAYSASINGIRYFRLRVVYNPTVVDDGNGGGGGGRGGGGGGGLPPRVNVSDAKCNESEVCTEWNTCQNLEKTYKEDLISEKDYIEFKRQCYQQGLDGAICGFQTRACDLISLCNETSKLPAQTQVCHYVENPSCSDNVKNCHSGKCEILVDCGGPCEPCPTCSDGIKNQKEEGIDCGGPCPNKCPDSAFVNFFKGIMQGIADNWVYFAAIIVLVVLIVFVIWLIKKVGEKSISGLAWYNLGR